MGINETFLGLWIIPILLWSIPWKGVALWKAARNSHKWWFIILLVVNTLAILEIIYIYAISRKKEAKSQEPLEVNKLQ